MWLFPRWSGLMARFISTRSSLCRGLSEFFEGGRALPVHDPEKKLVCGRAWRAAELRSKSFEDLHRLWFVLLKERNLLATQAAEAKRLQQLWFGKHRELKCKQSMARIKTVLTERCGIHERALGLIEQGRLVGSERPTQADLILDMNQQTIYKRAELKRQVRKGLNYRHRRQPLFT